MLVPFAIDPDGLAPDKQWTEAQERVCYQALADQWRRFGLLMHDGEKLENSRIFCAINALPQKTKSLLQALLQSCPIARSPKDWNGEVSTAQESLARLSTFASVVTVDDAKAEVGFAFADGDLSKKLPDHNGLEICRLIAIANSEIFKGVATQSGIHIPAGQGYAQLWKERFCNLARAPIKQISIIDRYVIRQQFECAGSKLSGLARFLRQLNADCDGPRYLSVFSAWTDEIKGKKITDVEMELKDVISKLESCKIKRITVHMLPNSVFGNIHHDRYVRFENYVWDIGRGLEIFEGPAVMSKSTASFKAWEQTESYKQVELELSQHAKAIKSVVNG